MIHAGAASEAHALMAVSLGWGLVGMFYGAVVTDHLTAIGSVA